MSQSNSNKGDGSQSHAAAGDHARPTSSDMTTNDTQGSITPAEPDLPLAEDELDIGGLPVELFVPVQEDEGARDPQVGNTVNSWAWTEDVSTPDIFQRLADQDLIDRTAIPRLPLRLRAPVRGPLLPLAPSTTLTSSLEAEADTSCLMTPTDPGPPAHTPSSLVGNIEEDLRGVGAALPLDSDQACQDE
ncbi:hypothetical protein IMZ48_45035 [Candidatus Bathyarchaeota archaeon]|nr:hypothetical protein [Candidatus Bathyarchaeota archaeon]